MSAFVRNRFALVVLLLAFFSPGALFAQDTPQITIEAFDIDEACAELREAANGEEDDDVSFEERINESLGTVVGVFEKFLFFPIPGLAQTSVPVTVNVQFEGPADTCIPAGSIVLGPGDREFALSASVLIDAEGNAAGSVVAQDSDRIAVEPGQIVSVLGLTAVGVDNEVRSNRSRAPFIVVWLFIGAIVLTLRMGFINLRGFGHAIQIVRGVYDDPDNEGEVTHFQALSSALSATVGLGNIAGVAVAVQMGGPGAVFWMIVAAFLGMTSKFVECTLGQKYRIVSKEGRVSGGPMRYLKAGLAKRGMGALGGFLAVIFMVFCIGGSFGGGNMFQANQAYLTLNSQLGGGIPAWAFGLVMMVLVGVVIIGGIRRIAQTAELIVPLMCGIYVLGALVVVLLNVNAVPAALSAIFNDAFSGMAVAGGVLGVMIQGIQRAAFSNEAGIGSAAIAHSAAKTDQPIREGMAAMLGPFIDTILVCAATGIVIIISGVMDDPASASENGANLTRLAFETSLPWFGWILSIAVLLFAYSTMISWSYYGERCWTSMFGERSSLVYKLIFLCFIMVGCVSSLESVMAFSDLMILSMAFPNILGLYIMSGEVGDDLTAYMGSLKDGGFKKFK